MDLIIRTPFPLKRAGLFITYWVTFLYSTGNVEGMDMLHSIGNGLLFLSVWMGISAVRQSQKYVV